MAASCRDARDGFERKSDFLSAKCARCVLSGPCPLTTNQEGLRDFVMTRSWSMLSARRLDRVNVSEVKCRLCPFCTTHSCTAFTTDVCDMDGTPAGLPCASPYSVYGWQRGTG